MNTLTLLLASLSLAAEPTPVAEPPSPVAEAPSPAPPEAAPALRQPVEPAPVARPAAKRKTRRIAVYDVKGVGLAPHLAPLVQSALAIELRKLHGAIVADMSDIRTMLDREAVRQLASCESDESCLAGVADALGAEILVTTSLTALSDDEVTISATRIDANTMVVREKYFARVKPDEGRALVVAVGPLVEQLFPDFSLAPGAVRGVNRAIVMRASPAPIPPAVTWSGVALSVTALAAAGGLGAWNLAVWNNLHTEDDGAVRARQAQELSVTGVGFYIAAGATVVVGATTGVAAAFLTDWESDAL